MHDNKWHNRFIGLAREIAKWSKDPSTQIGCVIVGPDKEIRSTGFNGFPRGVDDNVDRYELRDLKYMLVCHAEENAIMNAARIGTPLMGCTLYCVWPPCTRCARGIAQAGISKVVVPNVEIPDRWQPDFQLSTQLLQEAGVVFEKVS